MFKVTGCTYTNTGFDGASYQQLWPNGNTKLHPTPFQFTSPTTGTNYTKQYSQIGFEADLQAIQDRLQLGHRGGLHPHSANRLRHSGRVLSVLLHHQSQRQLLLAVRERHPGRDQ